MFNEEAVREIVRNAAEAWFEKIENKKYINDFILSSILASVMSVFEEGIKDSDITWSGELENLKFAQIMFEECCKKIIERAQSLKFVIGDIDDDKLSEFIESESYAREVKKEVENIVNQVSIKEQLDFMNHIRILGQNYENN